MSAGPERFAVTCRGSGSEKREVVSGTAQTSFGGVAPLFSRVLSRTGLHMVSILSETWRCLPSHCSIACADALDRSPEPAFSAVCTIGLTGSSRCGAQPVKARSTRERAKQSSVVFRFNRFTSKHQCNLVSSNQVEKSRHLRSRHRR